MDDRRSVNVGGRTNANDAEMNRQLFLVCIIEENKSVSFEIQDHGVLSISCINLVARKIQQLIPRYRPGTPAIFPLHIFFVDAWFIKEGQSPSWSMKRTLKKIMGWKYSRRAWSVSWYDLLNLARKPSYAWYGKNAVIFNFERDWFISFYTANQK